MQEREVPKANVSAVKYHAISDPQILRVSTVNTADSLETNQASSPPHCQVETLSSEKFPVDSSDNCRNYNRNYNDKIYTSDCLGTESQHELSLYDLLSDNEINGSSKEDPVRESHVAFSVDGLGKVGTETPPSSPRQSDRFISYGFFPQSKAARINDSYRKEMNNSSVVRECMQLDSQEREVRSPFFDGKASCNTRNTYEDLWDDRSNFVDDDFLCEKKCDMGSKSRLYHPEASLRESLEFGNDEIPDYAFDCADLQQKRYGSKATETFTFLDSFSPKKQTSDLINPRGARHHFADTCFDFWNPDCSGFVWEDARGSLSEESCSSTAVMADVSLASSRRRDKGRHHTSDFDSCQTYRGEKTIRAKEKVGTRKGKNTYFIEMPMLLDPKPGHFLSEERIGPHGSWLFEPGDINLGRSSPCPTIERKRPSTAFTEDFLHTSIPEPNMDADFSFSEHGVFSKFQASEKCTSFLPPAQRHCHNSPSVSKAEFPKRKPDLSSNSVDSGLESNFTHSSSDAFCHGDTLLSDLRELGSYESQQDTPKVEDEKIKPSKEITKEGIITSNSKESKERIVETVLLPEKISDKSESSVNRIEHHSNDEEPPGCEKENKVHLVAETERERSIANKRHGNCLNSSPQLMMLESFVLQLLCVHKVLEPTQ